MSNLAHNAEILKQSYSKSRTEFTKPPFEKKDILKLIKLKPKKLQEIKIKKFLGVGTYKIVFLLENGRVFSIFKESFMSPGQAEIQKFTKIKDLLFKGEAKKNDPMIYDAGSLIDSIFFVEMGYISSLKDWAEKNNISYDSIDDMFSLMMFTFISNEEVKEINVEFKKFISIPFKNKRFKNILKKTNLSIDQYKLLMFSLWRVIKRHNLNEFPDLHAGNLGVVPNTLYSDKPIFVFFDF